MFSQEQAAVIAHIVANFKTSATAFFINLFEVLRCKCNLDECKKSKRFSFREFRSSNIVTRDSILSCLINNSKVEGFINYVTENYEAILVAFKDLEIIDDIVEYTGKSLSKQFKTSNGFITITTRSKMKDADEDETVINLLDMKPVEAVVDTPSIFDEAQVAVINYMVSIDAIDAKHVFINLLELLHNNLDVSKCKKLMKYNNVKVDQIIYNGGVYKYDHDTEEMDTVPYVLSSAQSIAEYLLIDINDARIKAYVIENCNQILNTFKDLSIVNDIVEYTGNDGMRQFKTSTGYLDIRCANSIRDYESDSFIINLKKLGSPKQIERNVIEEETRYVLMADMMPSEEELHKIMQLYPLSKRFYVCIEGNYEMIRDRKGGRVMITHNDLDGIACGILAIINKQDFEHIWSCNYKHMTKNFADSLAVYDEVVCTDISFAEELRKPNMKFYDHHESAGFVNDHCGAYLYYQTLPKTANADRFVQLVDTWDCWRNDTADWNNACKLQYLFLEMVSDNMYKIDLLSNKNPYIYFINSMIKKLNTVMAFTPADKKLISRCESRIAKRLSEIAPDVKTDKNNYKYMIIEKKEDIDFSFVSNRLMKELELDWIAIDYGSNCSLRSSVIDLGTLMTISGHEHACKVTKEELAHYLQ